MKMILLKDVPGLGRRHEVKEVSPGYARNFLMPRKLAAPAAPDALANLTRSAVMEEAEERVKRELLRKNIEEVNGKKLVVKEPANEEGHLYAGIHKEEIAEYLRREFRLEIPSEFIVLEKPVKALGTFEIPIRGEARESTLTLVVEKE
ncbi:MAG: 50S ribosomal protein L9 [bacterium]|nr:50S ribosomal protein L9 [bacterium]